MQSLPRQLSTRKRQLQEPDCWSGDEEDSTLRCRACKERKNRDLKSAIRHEESKSHAGCLKVWKKDREDELHAAAAMRATAAAGPLLPTGQGAEGPQPNLLAGLSQLYNTRLQMRTTDAPSTLSAQSAATASTASSAPAQELDFSNLGDDYNWDQDPVTQGEAQISASLSAFLAGAALVESDSDSDDEDNERPAQNNFEIDEETTGLPAAGAARERVRNRTFDPENPFFPWSDQREFTLDVMMHLPRSVLSERQLDLLTWSMQYNGVNGVPSVSSMRNLNEALQTLFGVETIEYLGKLGHRYSVNSLSDLIAQEAANPLVGPHLEHLPSDAGNKLSNAYEARKWLEEIDPTLATPMIRRGSSQDFYIFEPALLTDGTACIPVRWFKRNGARFARAWRLKQPARRSTDANAEAPAGWLVDEYTTFDVSEDKFAMNFPEFCDRHSFRKLPSPTAILGSFITKADSQSGTVSPWTHTEPDKGNVRRAQAAGAEVRAFPIWLYCDDTSGNQSKKWNKHNSFLFTPAGLPRSHAHREFNVHFIATSNSAPVAEMLDGVIDQVEQCQRDGVWAYDVQTNQVIMLLPFVLALLGDNPMQSEFASHIGMKGKYFCRICWVKGVDRQAATGDDEEAADVSSDDSDGDTAATSKRKKFVESAQDMLARIKRFVSVGEPRNRSQTDATVSEIEHILRESGPNQKIKDLKTAKGVKDTFLQAFIDKLDKVLKGKRGAPRQAALDAAIAGLPESELRNAVFRLTDLDAHTDTPVEVLHVILLGIVKYFWRDAVKNQCKSPAKRATLISRLNSFNTDGLGIPPLRGETLVTYAGSLVGRDFRSIAQAAPFVLPDLVPTACYDAWVALSSLIPLIWQPEIADLPTYMTSLTNGIHNLLAATALWTPRWFNKPKFHLLVHLPAHIRRFGPAIIFATEAFESFNAVIRAKSIHSNRQAPSRDIARAFAQGNRIRHMLSGGYFRAFPRATPLVSRAEFRVTKPQPSDFARAGSAVLATVGIHSIVRTYLGMAEVSPPSVSVIATADKTPPRNRSETETAKHISGVMSTSPLEVQTCKQVRVRNGDVVSPGSWVLLEPLVDDRPGVVATVPTDTRPILGQVAEILQYDNTTTSRPSVQVLVHTGDRPTALVDTYAMPLIPALTKWSAADASTIICTVNTQHNCVKHGCKSSGTIQVVQERTVSSETRAVVTHKVPNDRILNMAQMRDAVHLQRLSILRPRLDMDACIRSGVAKELPARRVLQPTQPPVAPTPSATGLPAAAQRDLPAQRVPSRTTHDHFPAFSFMGAPLDHSVLPRVYDTHRTPHQYMQPAFLTPGPDISTLPATNWGVSSGQTSVHGLQSHAPQPWSDYRQVPATAQHGNSYQGPSSAEGSAERYYAAPGNLHATTSGQSPDHIHGHSSLRMDNNSGLYAPLGPATGNWAAFPPAAQRRTGERSRTFHHAALPPSQPATSTSASAVWDDYDGRGQSRALEGPRSDAMSQQWPTSAAGQQHLQQQLDEPSAMDIVNARGGAEWEDWQP